MMFNKVIMTGRLTKNPESKTATGGSGSIYCIFTVAINKKINGQDKATFVPCKAFQRTAEVLNKYCKKGSEVLVEGELSISQYKNKDGHDASWTEILVNRVVLLGSADTSTNSKINNDKPHEAGYTESDIPF